MFVNKNSHGSGEMGDGSQSRTQYLHADYSSSGPWILRNRNPKLKPTKIKLEDKIAAVKISPMTGVLLRCLLNDRLIVPVRIGITSCIVAVIGMGRLPNGRLRQRPDDRRSTVKIDRITSV